MSAPPTNPPATVEPEPLCIICIEKLQDGAQILTTLPCGHGFHSMCWDAWHLRHTSCPVCRFDVGPQSSNKRARLENEELSSAVDEEEDEDNEVIFLGNEDDDDEDDEEDNDEPDEYDMTDGFIVPDAIDDTNEEKENDNDDEQKRQADQAIAARNNRPVLASGISRLQQKVLELEQRLLLQRANRKRSAPK